MFQFRRSRMSEVRRQINLWISQPSTDPPHRPIGYHGDHHAENLCRTLASERDPLRGPSTPLPPETSILRPPGPRGGLRSAQRHTET